MGVVQRDADGTIRDQAHKITAEAGWLAPVFS